MKRAHLAAPDVALEPPLSGAAALHVVTAYPLLVNKARGKGQYRHSQRARDPTVQPGVVLLNRFRHGIAKQRYPPAVERRHSDKNFMPPERVPVSVC